MTAPVAFGSDGDAIPLLAVGGTAGLNNARDIRTGLLRSMLTYLNAGEVRQGVLLLQGLGEFQVIQAVSANQTVRVGGGSAIITRAGEGPYVVFKASGPTTVNMPLAPAANSRYDLVGVRLVDRNISADAASGLHGPYYDVIQGATAAALNLGGVPGAGGAPPIVPDGFLPLALVPRATNDNTITTAKIIDWRTTTAWARTPRIMWGGKDDLTAAGFAMGEEQILPAVGVLPVRSRRWIWDGVAARWQGLQDLTFYSTPTHAELGIPTDVTTVSIPDPGYPYVLEITGRVMGIFRVGSFSDARFDLLVNVSGIGDRVLTAVTRRYSLNQAQQGGTPIPMDEFPLTEATIHLPAAQSAPLTGSRTVVLRGDNAQGVGGQNFGVATSSPSLGWSQLAVTVKPA